MKAIIIDDEKDAREALSKLLKVNCQQVEIVGEAADGAEGVELIQQLKPDLVFLDVEMPHKDGFQVLEELGRIDFALIFATAYNKYAVQAFEFSTVAYLLKPINTIQLMSAVMKAQAFRRLQQLEEQYKLLLEIVKKQGTDSQYNHRICFSNQEEITFVAFKDLIRIEANGNSSSIYALGQSKRISVSKNIGEYFKLFKDIPFLFQTHRGHLVNLYHAKKIVRKDGGSLKVRNHNGEDDISIPVTSDRREELLQRIEDLKLC